MIILGVRFREVGKIYYYLCNDEGIKKGDKVIAQTKLGVECGTVMEMRGAKDFATKNKVEHIMRKATEEDLESLKGKRAEELRALRVCKDKIAHHKLNMKLIDAEYVFDRTKLIFYFVSDARVDFRNLVKDLAYIFKVRIELRQIGIRDEAKMLGGLGPCGKEFCCSTFLNDFQSVSIKMAKDQQLSLNPTKLSGACGRLMCCLKYEQDTYRDILRKMPKVGETVKVGGEEATVTARNVLAESIDVEIKEANTDNTEQKRISIAEL